MRIKNPYRYSEDVYKSVKVKMKTYPIFCGSNK